MKIIYAKKSSGIDEQGSFQNPSYYDKPNKDAESVVIYGDYPQIKADYEELGIQVEVRELPKAGLIQGEPADLTGLVPTEQFDAVALDLANTKEQLDKEREAVKKLTAENSGLKDKLLIAEKALVAADEEIKALKAAAKKPTAAELKAAKAAEEADKAG